MKIADKEAGIWEAPYRSLTIGIIIAVTTVAFEGLAITTIAPRLANQLNGLHLYGWIFSAFLLSQIIGTMIAGQRINQNGVFASFIGSIVCFVVGIVIAATSANMFMLIAGRACQGFGAGAIITCVYYSITLRYPDALRTKILAAFSSAYVLPALVGPYVAGRLAELSSWRFVFWSVLPLIALAVFLTLPTLRKLQASDKSVQKGSPRERYAVMLAIGTGLLLSGFGWITDWKGGLLAVVGIALMIVPLRKLLPEGTFSARAGLPATIVARALFVACYFATESYVVLALTDVNGLPADLAGLIVAAGALSWSAAAWLQSKLDERDGGLGRNQRVAGGIGVMIVGVALVMTAVAYPAGGIVFAIISQIFTGFGIGLAHPTTGAIALQRAKTGEEGEVSANIQFTDAFSPGVSIGLGGALIAIGEKYEWSLLTAVMSALSIQLIFVVLSLIVSLRIRKA